MALGIQGQGIGQMLSYLLDMVMAEPAYNTKETLLALCEARLGDNQKEGQRE